jgi:uncharacterized protein (DUF433 family)
MGGEFRVWLQQRLLSAGETFEAVVADYGVSVSDLRDALDAIAA